jgi:hypothetical protein
MNRNFGIFSTRKAEARYRLILELQIHPEKLRLATNNVDQTSKNDKQPSIIKC